MKIEITQYMRPDGQSKTFTLEIPDEYRGFYQAIVRCNCALTCEQFMTGQAAHYITHELGDYAIEISQCGNAADECLLKMIKNFDPKQFEIWLTEMKTEEEIESEI